MSHRRVGKTEATCRLKTVYRKILHCQIAYEYHFFLCPQYSFNPEPLQFHLAPHAKHYYTSSMHHWWWWTAPKKFVCAQPNWRLLVQEHRPHHPCLSSALYHLLCCKWTDLVSYEETRLISCLLLLSNVMFFFTELS